MTKLFEQPQNPETGELDLSKVRNIGIFAHVDAGKTTITDRILALCGIRLKPRAKRKNK